MGTTLRVTDKETGIRQFAGADYADWKFRMSCLFDEKGLSTYIEDRPSDLDILNETWVASMKVAKNLIVKHVAPSHLNYIKSKTTAFDMWENLRKTFEPTSMGKRISVRKRLNAMQFKGNESLQTFFAKFDALVDEFNAVGGKLESSELVMQLLISMPDDYENVVTILESMDEGRLTYDVAKGALLERELKLVDKNESKKDDVSSAAFSSNKSNKGQNKYKGKKKSSDREIKCFTCGEPGHKSPSCSKNSKSANLSGASGLGKDDENQVTRSHAMMCTGGANTNRIQFVIDSGATDHLIMDLDLLQAPRKLQFPIEFSLAGEQASLKATHGGTMRLHSRVGEREMTELYLQKVYAVPGLRHNLFSVTCAEAAGGEVLFKNGKALVKFNGQIFAVGHRRGSLYYLDFQIVPAEINLVQGKDQNELWHRRLGHLSMGNVCKLINTQMATGTDTRVSSLLDFCEPCVKAKSTRQPYSGSRPATKRPLERVHTDVCGPMPVVSNDGYRYFVTFTDDFTHLVVTYLLHSKSEVVDKLKEYVAMATSHFDSKMSRLRSDRGGEFTSNEVKAYCKSKGIVMELNPPYNPELNGVAERLNRTLLDKARSMLIESGLPDSLWDEAVMAATYLTNRSPTAALKNKTPFQAWFGRKPNISNLRVFGCHAFSQVPAGQRSKLGQRSVALHMVGYDNSGYRLWNPENDKITVSRNVVFDESLPVEEVLIEDSTDQVRETDNSFVTPKRTRPEVKPITPRPKAKSAPLEAESATDDELEVTPSNSSSSPERNDETVIRRYPVRATRNLRPRKLQDYELNMAMSAVNWIEDAPLNYRDVLGRPDEKEWRKAIKSEIESLEENLTWQIVPKPENAKLLGSRWVFKIKDEPMSSRKYKARLVARGFQQKEGIDYTETYAPVARLPTIRFILVLAINYDLHTRHLDVTTAFLYGDLPETVYLNTPEGVSVPEGKVLKLCKSLYGLKQAPKCWNLKFHNFMVSLGFERSKADSCLYVWQSDDKSLIYLVLYVDDMLIVSNHLQKLNALVDKMAQKFKMKDLGEVSRFMGLNVKRTGDSLEVDQLHFVDKLISRFGMKDCNPVKTPMEVGLKLNKSDKSPTEKPYRELVGSLMYLTMGSRPDLGFPVNYFSRFQEGASENHWNHLKRVVRYLKGSRELKLIFKRRPDISRLSAFVDADWAGDESDRKSTSGFLIFVHGSAVMWSSKKQPIVTTSSTEAEFVAANAAVCEVIWFRKIFNDLLQPILEPSIVYEDNQGAIYMSKNAETKRTKHIDVRYYFLRDCVENKTVSLQYVPTKRQVADILTKAIPKDQFQNLVTRVMSGSVVDETIM